MKKAQPSDWIIGITNGILYPEVKITTEEFVTMIVRNSRCYKESWGNGWSTGYMEYALQKGLIEDYDMLNKSKPIERRSVARIVHEALITEFGERDEVDWSLAENLHDLYLCHTCVMHIAQVYVKGIMLGIDYNNFHPLGSITHSEAGVLVERMNDPKQRITQTKGKKSHSKILSPDEAWELMRKEDAAMLIDVRTEEEYKKGHIDCSICIPLQHLINNPYSVCNRKYIPLILYCQKGYKSLLAAQTLIDAGYSKIYTIPGIEQYSYPLTQ